MSVVMNILRQNNQLGDYLFPSDMEKFNLDNLNSLQWSNQAVSKEQELHNLDNLDVISRNTLAFHYLGDNLRYRPSSTHPAQIEEVMNENYAKAVHPASERTRNKGNAAASNKNLQKPGKKVKNSKKSHFVDGSHEEKIKIPDNFSSEQEHQNQMNMIFNNPEYFQQFAHQLQQDQHQDHPYPTMYIIPLESDSQIIPEPSIESHQDPHDTDININININTTVTTLSNSSYSVKSEIDVDYSSDYYSDSASSSLSSSSSSSPCMSSASSSCGGDLDDDEPMDLSSSYEVDYHFNKLISNENERTSLLTSNFFPFDDNQDVPLELDEELNNLVLSIITE